MPRLLHTLTLAALLGGTSFSTYALDVNYADLPDLVGRNLKMQSADMNVQSAQKQEGFAKRASLPQLAGVAGYEAFAKGRDEDGVQPYAGVEGTLNLYNGGKNGLQEKVLQQETEQQRQEALATYREELRSARELFAQIKYQDGMLVLLDKTVKLTQGNLGSANKRIQAKLATVTDATEFKLRQTELKREKVNTQSELATIEHRLKAKLGLKPDEPLKLLEAAHKEPQVVTETLTLDPATHPSVLTLAAVSKALELQKEQASRWQRPVVELYGVARRVTGLDESGDSRDRQESAAGIRMRLPLYDGGTGQAEAASLGAKAKANQYEQQYQSGQLTADFIALKQQYTSLQELYHQTDHAIETARQLHRQTADDYSKGQKSSRDMQEATERLLDEQREQLAIHRDLHLTAAALLALAGEDTKTIK